MITRCSMFLRFNQFVELLPLMSRVTKSISTDSRSPQVNWWDYVLCFNVLMIFINCFRFLHPMINYPYHLFLFLFSFLSIGILLDFVLDSFLGGFFFKTTSTTWRFIIWNFVSFLSFFCLSLQMGFRVHFLSRLDSCSIGILDP